MTKQNKEIWVPYTNTTLGHWYANQTWIEGEVCYVPKDNSVNRDELNKILMGCTFEKDAVTAIAQIQNLLNKEDSE